MRRRHSLTLFLDADDTLWENNVHYRGVVDRYCEELARHGCAPDMARRTLLDVERAQTRVNGYGIYSFQRSLEDAVRCLVGHLDPALEARLRELCRRLAREPIQLRSGVRDTLRELSGRHRLILLTKGDPDNQMDKVHRSGLRAFLHQVDVVPEKDTAAYRDAVRRHGVQPAATWMIGNSPRSDVLPALAAGLGVVFIPHPATWELEHAPMPESPAERFVVLEQFSELAALF